MSSTLSKRLSRKWYYSAPGDPNILLYLLLPHFRSMAEMNFHSLCFCFADDILMFCSRADPAYDRLPGNKDKELNTV